MDAADAAVDKCVQKIKGVLISLEHNAPQTLISNQKPKMRPGDEMAMALPLDELPTREVIAAALTALEKAHNE